MTESSNTPHLRSFIADTLAGLGLFAVGTSMVAGPSAFAESLSFSSPDALVLATTAGPGGNQTVVMLGLVFSVLFAFNAAFFRHLGRAYAKTPERLG